MRRPTDGSTPRPSLSASLTASFLIFGALVLSVSSSLQLASVIRIQGRAVSSEHQAIAQDAAISVRAFVQEKIEILQATVWLSSLYSASGARRELVMDSLLGLQPAFRELILLDEGGAVLSRVSRLPRPQGLFESLGSQALAGTRRSGSYLSPVRIQPESGEPLMLIAVPLFDALKDFRGSLVAEVNLRFMWDMISALKLRETGYAYVVDRQGTLLAFGDRARVLKGENLAGLRVVADFLRDPGEAGMHSVTSYRGIDGKAVVGSYVPLGLPDWAVVTELPWADAYREAIRQFAVTLAITLGTAALAGLTGLVMARRLSVPIEGLMRTAARIAGGERNLQAETGGPREVAALAAAFNSMTAQLSQSLEALEARLEEVKRAQEERARLQEQLQQAMKMEAIGQLAGGVAHDFNNLLTVIIGNVDLARLKLGPSDPSMAFLDPIDAAAESAAGLTRQLLAFARRQIIQPKLLCLNELVQRFERAFYRLLGEDIVLETSMAEGLWPVKVDPGQIEQILVNLATNARAAMPSGGRLLIETSNVSLDAEYCSRHTEAQPGEYALLAVSDTGHGMSAETLSHLFEPFFTTKPVGQGTGLGLATVFGIVKQSRGSIEVYSEEGRGTTFKIYFPRMAGRAEPSAAEGRAADPPTGKESVMVVEDNDGVRRSTAKALSILGYEVLEPATAEEAIETAAKRAEGIDLLLTDVVMPQMNGPELAQRLTALHPETKVLFTSGYTYNVIAHHGIVDEELNFISKPYTVRDLAARIKKILMS